MGCDIHGFIEVKTGDTWEAAEDIRDDVQRNYDMFGMLFGVRNYVGFAPIAPQRGIPTDAATKTQQEYQRWDEDAHSPSWLAYSEIAALNRDEVSASPDERIHEYRQNAAGEWEAHSKSAYSSVLAHALGVDYNYRSWPVGTEWNINGTLYRVEAMRRGDIIPSEWEKLFSRMASHATTHGPDGVRMVVWFDN